MPLTRRREHLPTSGEPFAEGTRRTPFKQRQGISALALSVGPHYLTPSVVGIDHDGSVLVGEAAKERQVVEPGRCSRVNMSRYHFTGQRAEVVRPALQVGQQTGDVGAVVRLEWEAARGSDCDQVWVGDV